MTVVFGTLNYLPMVERWREHALRAGCTHYVIVCMDDALLDHLREDWAEVRANSYYDVFPELPKIDVAAIPKHKRKFRQTLWLLRIKLFHQLLRWGYSFIHSDADAFWHRDPRPWLLEQHRYDILWSQGTISPHA